jgi:hypothetical protein
VAAGFIFMRCRQTDISPQNSVSRVVTLADLYETTMNSVVLPAMADTF